MNASVRRMGERALSCLQRVVPKGDIITIHGTPVTEGNAVEMMSALSRRYRGKLYWLTDGEPNEWTFMRSRTPVTFVKKNTFRGVFLYLRSEIVFFTHGLFGAVKPSTRQTFVNLWHGDGIKRKPTMEASIHSPIPATFVSGGTACLTARKATDFKMPEDATLVFGNPRVVQFRDPLPPAFLSAIGLNGCPYIVWMPTFRKSALTGVGYEDDRVRVLMAKVIDAARHQGYRVVVKAHRQDVESRNVPGAISVSDAMLLDHGASLYSLLGGSAALVTDYSSVWTDYLLLDRPIGFLIPDAETYSRTRGLYPQDVLEWIPGPRLESDSDISSFIHALTATEDASRDQRTRAKAKLGVVSFDFPADEILSELDARGCFRHGYLDHASTDTNSRPSLMRNDE